MDTPQTGDYHDQSESDLEKVRVDPETTDTASPDGKQERFNQQRHHGLYHGQYVVKALKATRRGVAAVVNWTDEKGGFITALATVIIAILTAFYVHYSRAQWKVMSDQLPDLHASAQAAQQSAKVAQDTLIASNRPWLDIQLKIIGPLTFDDLGAHLPLQIEATNIGHSPAVRVADEQEFIQIIIFNPNPWQEIKKLCQQAGGESALASNRGLTQTIFPGKSQQQALTLTLSPAELNRELTFNGVSKKMHLFPAVVWCVAYTSDFSEVEHHIGYAWQVLRNAPPAWIDPKRGTVPAEKLTLYQFPFIGPLAD